MNIKREIEAWNGKSTDDILKIYQFNHEKNEFIDTIIELIKDIKCQKGATWLLKKWLESGKVFDTIYIDKVYGELHNLTGWESRLHILQSIPFMPITKKRCKDVEKFLRNTLTDSNKFVRAWSYNAFYELAIQYPKYEIEVKQFFDMALRDEAPSVKARIRNIIKKGF